MSSQELVARIRQKLTQYPDNLMPFSAYMSSCLYEPQFGYYTVDRLKVGREGDFYTSVQVGSIMAEMVASYIKQRCVERKWRLSDVTVVEWGAGTGRLASQLLAIWRDEAMQPARYAMVETSPYHREQALALLTSLELYKGEESIVWWTEKDVIDRGTEEGAPLIVIANELLDAFPIERLRRKGEQYEMAYVGWDEANSQFMEHWEPASEEACEWMAKHEIKLYNGQIYDAHIEGAAWLKRIWSELGEAEGLFLDYGDSSLELTAPHRMRGTMLCYYRHQAHDNPYIHVGIQDMTSFVDFDVYTEALKQACCTSQPLLSQQEFLVQQGVLNELQQHAAIDPFSETAKRNRSIRQLLLSDQMSERFKAMRVSKYVTV